MRPPDLRALNGKQVNVHVVVREETHVATVTCLLMHGRVLYVAKIAPTSWLPPPALYLIKPLICQCRAALSRPVAWRQR